MAEQVTGARAAAPAFAEGGGTGLQVMDVTSNEDESKTVSLVNSAMTFIYYESILQDAVRATITYSDTGNTIDKKTAMEGLPIVGQERVKVKFSDNNDKEINVVLYVNKVTPLLDDSRKSVVKLELSSREYIWNEKVRVNKRFDGKISDHVRKMLEDPMYLGPTAKAKAVEGYQAKELDIEDTANKHNFIGNNKKVYYLINWLARGAVPSPSENPSATSGKGNSAGFFFYETANKLHFKSIDALMNTEKNEPKKTILYNESPDGSSGEIPAGYDYKALQYSVDNKVNIQDKLKMGAYSTRLITFNPFNTYYEVVTPNAGNAKGAAEADAPGNQENLELSGEKLPTLNAEFNVEGKGKEFTRTTYYILDNGTLPEGKGVGKDQQSGAGQVAKSKDENYKPGEVLNQGIMRMNQLFALKTSLTIPGDFSLHAGDAIYVDAPQLQQDTKNDEVDKQMGGNYVISDVAHFISPKNTLTKLSLVRDSFGRKAKTR